MSAYPDPCEYNPNNKRAAYENEVHGAAEVIVGANGQWRLCKSCAGLPEFNRFKKTEIASNDLTTRQIEQGATS